MNVSDVSVSSAMIPCDAADCSDILLYTASYSGPVLSSGLSEPDRANRIVAELSVDELLKSVASPSQASACADRDFFFYGGGWQSWGFGGEVEPGKFPGRYIPVIPQWLQYTRFPGTPPRRVCGRKSASGRLLKGQFIAYLRWDDTYLVLCSSARAKGEVLPPVQFYVDRGTRRITVTAYSDGKAWRTGEKMAELSVFTAEGFFALRDAMRSIFGGPGSGKFDGLRFLSGGTEFIKTCGWESWYNHYSDINQALIDKDLDFLGRTGNIIKTCCLDKGRPVVFQVDDGWERALGQWDVCPERFPGGMESLASSIAEKGYIPGLWMAPLIIDWRCDTAREHRDWILRDKDGKPVEAGYGPLWGAKKGPDQPGRSHSYYCLDLSREDVVLYLDSLMDKVINGWGFRYLKLDFLFAGMIYGAYKNGGAGYEWYDRAIKILTKRKVNGRGEPVAYLGCGLPLEASCNEFPLSRIGPDTKEDWDFKVLARVRWEGRPGALPNLLSTLGHAFFDQSVFINDPDVVFLRYENTSLTDTEKELIALTDFMFASQLMHSDDPASFDDATDGVLTRRVAGLYERLSGEEWGLVNVTGKTYILFSRSGNYCGLINLSDKCLTVSRRLVLGRAGKSGDAELSAVVSHVKEDGDRMRAEPHSISVFEIK